MLSTYTLSYANYFSFLILSRYTLMPWGRPFLTYVQSDPLKIATLFFSLHINKAVTSNASYQVVRGAGGARFDYFDLDQNRIVFCRSFHYDCKAAPKAYGSIKCKKQRVRMSQNVTHLPEFLMGSRRIEFHVFVSFFWDLWDFLSCGGICDGF